jgi:hypothetical protein
MHFYNVLEEGALEMNIEAFRKRVSDALMLGSLESGGGLELIDKDMKIQLEYKDFKQSMKKRVE